MLWWSEVSGSALLSMGLMKCGIDSQPAPGKRLKEMCQLKFIPLEDIDYYICEVTGVTMCQREIW